VETNKKLRHKQGNEQREQREQHEQKEAMDQGDSSNEVRESPPIDEPQNVKEAAPGAPIVRSSTPRPFASGSAIPPSQLPSSTPPHSLYREPSSVSAFPAKPPSAPPLPEEPVEYIEVGENANEVSTPLPKRPASVLRETQEFVWLFEYGLEMDSSLLNTPERLDGLALLYGPAVLKGYRTVFGKYMHIKGSRTLVTIVSDQRPDAEVWGVLYRIPQRVTEESGEEPSLLDTIHLSPQNVLQARQVVVHEIYRNRELPCVTYGSSNESLQDLQPLVTQDDLDVFVQRLTTIAREQKLPDFYIKQLAASMIPTTKTENVPNKTQRVTSESPVALAASVERVEQNTEPLSLPIEKLEKQSTSPLINPVRRLPLRTYPNRWLGVFALYLFCLLLVVLAFAVLQGMGIADGILNEKFVLLNVPWLVLVYGLVGGCVSSIVTLGRSSQEIDPPGFVLITWFTRPFIGAVLAIFAYLLLSSGLFASAEGVGGRHEALLLLVGALAGLCEGWLFLRKG